MSATGPPSGHKLGGNIVGAGCLAQVQSVLGLVIVVERQCGETADANFRLASRGAFPLGLHIRHAAGLPCCP